MTMNPTLFPTFVPPAVSRKPVARAHTWVQQVASFIRPQRASAVGPTGGLGVVDPRHRHPAANECFPLAAPTAASAANSPQQHPTPARVRVVVWPDASVPHPRSGRMRISGSMAAVCAELDRLAACEAA